MLYLQYKGIFLKKKYMYLHVTYTCITFVLITQLFIFKNYFMQALARLYRSSDGKLIQTADDFVNSAERDEAQLEELGFDESDRLEIIEARNAFSDTHSDYFLMGAVMTATEVKNALRKELSHETRQITGLAKLHFGGQSGAYRRFESKELSKQTDNDFVRTCRGVARAVAFFATEMADEGYNATKLAAYTAKINSLDSAIDDQHEAIKIRDNAVNDRIVLGNHLYSLLVVLATKGKLCWIDVNEALYNDYIIYQSSHSPAQVVEGEVPGNGVVVSTSITDASANTVLEISNTGSVPITCFFAALPTDNSSAQQVVIPPNSTKSHPAIVLGYTQQSRRFNIVNDAPTMGSYRVAWE